MSAAAARTPRVFIVDDDEGARGAVGALLALESYELSFADRGRTALDRMEDVRPDVVILDVMMPGMDGFEVCKRLKADPRSRHVPVVLLTALSEREHIQAGLDAGADEFLNKPVGGFELRTRVRSMLRIKRQYDELTASLRLREDLANLIVHDMRTPLAAVMGYAELALTREASPEVRADWLSRIRGSALRLSHFTDEILLVSKLEHGKLRLQRGDVELVALVAGVAKDLTPLVEARHVRVAVESDGPVPVQADASLLVRVAENLLSNAIKFSPRDSVITARVSAREGGGGRLQVADHGPGIPTDRRGALWDKFEIVEARRAHVPQVGLGLYFVRLAAEAHGGRVAYEPNTPTGSIFTIEV